MSGELYIHRALSENVRPWVARIGGTSERFGFDREFIAPIKDWTRASRTMRGRLRGLVYAFPLRVGWVVEVQEGDRHDRPIRYFARVAPTGLDEISAEEAMVWAAEQDELTRTSAP